MAPQKTQLSGRIEQAKQLAARGHSQGRSPTDGRFQTNGRELVKKLPV